MSGATGQGRPVEARLTGMFVAADPPDNADAARTNLPGADLNAACSGPEGARPRMGRVISAQRTDGVKQGRGWRGRAFGPSNCRSLRHQRNARFYGNSPAQNAQRMDKKMPVRLN